MARYRLSLWKHWDRFYLNVITCTHTIKYHFCHHHPYYYSYYFLLFPEEMNYSELLKNAPPHDSPEFIDYLRQNSVVIKETANWLLVENVKYYTKQKQWYTLFNIGINGLTSGFDQIIEPYKDWNWLKKSANKQTVKRFHIHIYKD